MGKVILVITLAAIVSCYAAADKKRVRKSEQGQVLGLLLYYGLRLNETCELGKTDYTNFTNNETFQYELFYDFEEHNTYKYSYYITNRKTYQLNFSIEGNQCNEVQIEFLYCSENRILRDTNTNCINKKKLTILEPSYTCEVTDNRLSSNRILTEFSKFSELNRCKIKIIAKQGS